MKIKICGITNEKDAALLEKMGANYAGFIFYPPSKRNISFARAKQLRSLLNRTKPVAVTVNMTADEILRLREITAINIIQLHGNESQIFIDQLAKDGFEVWKAISLKDPSQLTDLDNLRCSHFLIDSFSDKAKGGTGIKFDWQILKDKREILKKSFIAGGITVENVSEIASYNPFGIDLSSGVEISPGIKNHDLVKELFSKLQLR